MEKKGTVYLVGAGPGDPGLITEKGLFKLESCDALVYDHLACEDLLERTPDNCRKIYVGKQAGLHSMKQEEISQILVDLAKEGLEVVRLKGGDPFVFGRGGEEILSLQREDIPYEVIPGVTSAVAVLAAAGIPVTHRALSRSFHVMTGHTMTEEGTLPPDFPEFAKLSGTLIFLMGLGNLPVIVKGLRNAGKPGNTPAAVISGGTLPGQRVVRGTLQDIVKKAEDAAMKTPAIIAVGETVALSMESTHHAPLEGISVGITGTDSLREKLRAGLMEEGASVKCLLQMQVVSHRGEVPMRKAYENLGKYTWIVFTSPNAVREFFMGLLENGRDHRSLNRVKFAAVGKGTARQLREQGFLADYMPKRYQVFDLAEGLKGLAGSGDRLLIPRSAAGSPELTGILLKEKIPYDDIVLYEVKGRRPEGKAFGASLEKVDYITFASASGVAAFFEGLNREERRILDGKRIVCIGDVTARSLQEQGREADVVADPFSAEGIVEAILKDAADKKKVKKV